MLFFFFLRFFFTNLLFPSPFFPYLSLSLSQVLISLPYLSSLPQYLLLIRNGTIAISTLLMIILRTADTLLLLYRHASPPHHHSYHFLYFHRISLSLPSLLFMFPPSFPPYSFLLLFLINLCFLFFTILSIPTALILFTFSDVKFSFFKFFCIIPNNAFILAKVKNICNPSLFVFQLP